MVVLSLDTHELVKELTGAGFTEQQAEAVTRAVVAARDLDLSHLATKDDLAALENRIDARFQELEARWDARFQELEARWDARFQELEARWDARFQELEARTESRFQQMEAKIDGLRAELKADMEILKRDMTIRLGAMIAAAVALMTALDQLL